MKFVAVHWVGLMTHRKCHVDCSFPYYATCAGLELSPPPPLHIEAPGSLFTAKL
jgi:hypothetical protein